MKKFLLTTVGALVLVGASAGTTAALTASSAVAPPVVHAYYRNTTHAMFFSNSTAHPAGTTAISWLQRGTAGAKGIDVTARAITNNAGVSSIKLDCPASNPCLIGGGGGGLYPEMLVYNGPADMGKGWGITVYDSDGNYPAQSIYVHVICAR